MWEARPMGRHLHSSRASALFFFVDLYWMMMDSKEPLFILSVCYCATIKSLKNNLFCAAF